MAMTKEMCDRPTAFFDSGLGGLSVLREAVKLMPHEDYLYFGDSANAPYGTKTIEEIQALTLKNVERLYRSGIKALVIACNTATSAAIHLLREIYTDIPVVGIEPALKPAVSISEHPNVIVMATPLTVKAQKFRDLLGQYESKASVTPLSCPGLMEFVERGELDTPELKQYLRALLEPVLSDHQIDAIVLGCTHYPFLREEIRKIAGESVMILDGGLGTAQQLRRKLSTENLLSRRSRQGIIRYEESDPSRIPLCKALMARPF